MDIERYLGKYLGMVVHAYNPDQYVAMMEYPWQRYLKFFVLMLLVTIAVFVVSLIPVSLTYIAGIPERLDAVDNFELSANISAQQPVEILPTPSIVLDLAGESDAVVVLSDEGVRYPRFFFSIFGYRDARWEDLSDLKQPTETRDSLLFWIVIFLLPSIIFWFALVNVVQLLFVLGLLVLLGYYGPRLFKHRISASETVKVAILAMPSVMIIGVGLSPLAPGTLFWWGLLLTCIFFVLGLALLSERRKAKYKRTR